MSRATSHLDGLTGVRFLAAFHVVLFHLGYELFDTAARPFGVVAKTGYVGVSFFFILSGFVLAYNYDAAAGPMDGAGRLDFWAKRLARVFPLYLVSLLLLASLDLPALLKDTTPAQTGLQVLMHLTMTSAWYPKAVTTWNYPSWSVCDEAFFYAVFPLASAWLALTSRRRILLAMAGLWALSLLAPALYIVADPDHIGATMSLFYKTPYMEAMKFNPLVRLPEFLLGILLARLLFQPATQALLAKAPAVAIDLALAAAGLLLFAGLAAAVELNYVSLMIHNGALAPLFCLIIAGLASGRGRLTRLLALRPLRVLGEASYSLYLLQIPLAMHFYTQSWTAGISAPALFGLYAGLLIALSVASHYLVERPARRLMLAWLRPTLRPTLRPMLRPTQTPARGLASPEAPAAAAAAEEQAS